MRRGLLVAGVLLTLVVGATVGAGLTALHRAEAALSARGLRWQARELTGTGVTWTGIEGPGLHADRAVASFFPRPRLNVQGVDVDLSQVELGGEEAALDAAGASLPSVPVEVEGLALRFREEVLAEGLAGSLRPEVSLAGEGVGIGRTGGQWHANLDRALTFGPLQAHGQLDVSLEGDRLRASFRADDAVLTHPLLATGPLPERPLQLQLRYGLDDGSLDLAARLGGVEASMSGRFDLATRAFDLHASADEVPLTEVIDLFGRHVPEGQRASCSGTLGISVDISGPPLRWEAWPRAEDLFCEGVLVDVDALRSGAVTWKAIGPEGEPTVKRTGPGQPLWTPWPEARPVAEAMMAAEDVAFPSHPGYDLSAIKEVLDEAASGSDRLRGGSTLTQQLAKNLFLDGERTLARKLRELIYTLDLEAQFDKRHILQLYVNIVELGPDIHGVGPAANTYFAKRPGTLTDREAAFLAALLPDPTTGYARAMAGRPPDRRIDAILDNMQHASLRSPEQVAKAKRARLMILPPPP